MKRSEKITQTYNKLIQTYKDFLGEQEILPTLDDIDLVDVVNYVNLELKPLEGEYKTFIVNLASSYQLKYNNKDFENAYPKIKTYLDDLVKLSSLK